MLDIEVADLGFQFLTLKAILDLFPLEPQWIENLLSAMHAAVLEANEKRGKNDEPIRTRRTITRAEHQAALDRIAELEYQVKQLELANERLKELLVPSIELVA